MQRHLAIIPAVVDQSVFQIRIPRFCGLPMIGHIIKAASDSRSSIDFQLAYQQGGTMVTKYLEFVLGKSLKQDTQRGTALIMDWLV